MLPSCVGAAGDGTIAGVTGRLVADVVDTSLTCALGASAMLGAAVGGRAVVVEGTSVGGATVGTPVGAKSGCRVRSSHDPNELGRMMLDV